MGRFVRDSVQIWCGAKSDAMAGCKCSSSDLGSCILGLLILMRSNMRQTVMTEGFLKRAEEGELVAFAAEAPMRGLLDILLGDTLGERVLSGLSRRTLALNDGDRGEKISW